jgi:TatA/E family protein of Tat protein translocase
LPEVHAAAKTLNEKEGIRMFALSPAHIILILGIMLLLFGPKFFEDMFGNLKSGVNGFQKSFKETQKPD